MINLQEANEKIFKQLQINNLNLLYEIIEDSNFNELSVDQVRILIEENSQHDLYRKVEKILQKYKNEYFTLVMVLFHDYELEDYPDDSSPATKNDTKIILKELKKFIKDSQK